MYIEVLNNFFGCILFVGNLIWYWKLEKKLLVSLKVGGGVYKLMVLS